LIHDYALFKSENGTLAFIARRFISINNVTVNSIALIDPEGNSIPLGQCDAVGVRLLPGSNLDNMLAPHDVIESVECVPSQGAVYVGKSFNNGLFITTVIEFDGAVTLVKIWRNVIP